MLSKSKQRRLAIQKYSDLPEEVIKALFEEDPEWNWIRVGDHLIFRAFDDMDEELDRFVCKVLHVVGMEEF